MLSRLCKCFVVFWHSRNNNLRVVNITNQANKLLIVEVDNPARTVQQLQELIARHH